MSMMFRYDYLILIHAERCPAVRTDDKVSVNSLLPKAVAEYFGDEVSPGEIITDENGTRGFPGVAQL
jgi:hypothetical protein